MRHWVLAACWCVLVVAFAASVAGTNNYTLLGSTFLVSPIVALVGLAKLWRRRASEERVRGVHVAQRLVAGSIVLCALAGIVASAGRMSEMLELQNAPLAALFLVALFSGWPAFTRPTPRALAVPAVFVHLLWVPAVLWNTQQYEPASWPTWRAATSGVAIIGLLGLTSVAQVLALVGYRGPRAPLPDARAV